MTEIGDLLKKEREKKGLGFEDVEKKTLIRKKYLKAIEEENWQHFPSLTYIQGTIKAYGSFLGLDQDKLLAFFRREYDSRDEIKFKTRLPNAYFTPKTKKIIRLAIAIIIVGFISYFSLQFYLYLSPPKVTILEPQKTVFRSETIKLIGQTEKEAIVFINGQRVYLDEKNQFTSQIPLVSKKTTVNIEVTGANGRKTTLFKVFEKR